MPTATQKGIGGLAYNQKQWGSWDTTAGQDLASIQQLHQQIIAAGGQPPPQAEYLMSQMRSWNRKRQQTGDGDAARYAYELRTQLKNMYEKAFNQGQQTNLQNQMGQQTDMRFQAPGSTVASDLGDWGGVVDPGSFNDIAKMFGFNYTAPGVNPTDVSATTNRTGLPDMSAFTAPNNNVVPQQLTTGAGAMAAPRMPGAVTLPGSTTAAPAPQGPSGAQFTGIDSVGGVGSTGDVELDQRLRSLLLGQETNPVAQALNKLIQQSAQSGGAVVDEDFSKYTKAEQAHVDAMRADISRQSAETMKMAAADMAASGRRGSRGAERMQENLALQLAERLAKFETGFAVEREGQKRQFAVEKARLSQSNLSNLVNANAVMTQLAQTDKWETVKQLIDLQAGNMDRDLRKTEVDAKYTIMEENVQILRDQFTEDQRQSLVKEGFSERQITAMEQELKWRTAFEMSKFAADHNLAVRNTDIAEKVQNRELDITELKNKNDVHFQTRAQELAEFVGVRQQMTAEEKMDYMWKTLQAEYGINLNKLELARWQATGQMSLNVLNADRAYNLDVAKQRDAWMQSQAGLALEERLRVLGYELEEILQGKQLDEDRDRWLSQQVLEYYGYDWKANQNALDRAFEKWKVEEAARQQAKQRKGSFLGGLLKTVVGAGARIGLAAITGGTSEIVGAGIAAASSLANQGSVLPFSDMTDTVANP